VAVIQKDGLGYSSRKWRDSATIAYVRLLSEDVRIYSNGVTYNGGDAIGFLTERESRAIPTRINPLTTKANPHFYEEIEAMCKDIIKNNAILVYLGKDLSIQSDLVPCRIPVLQRFEDGTVYGRP
jgi:hypothetical protein